MKKNKTFIRLLICLLFLIASEITILASNIAGIYHSTVNCRKDYDITLSIFNTDNNNYSAFMRVKYYQNERNSWIVEGEYLGSLVNNELQLYLQNSSEIRNEKQSKKKYFHGIRYKPKSTPFIKPHLKVSNDHGSNEIRIISSNYSNCAIFNLRPADKERNELSIKRFKDRVKYQRWEKGLKKAKLESDKVASLLKWSEPYRKTYPDKNLKIRGNRDKIWDSADSPYQLFLPENMHHLGYNLEDQKDAEKLLKKIKSIEKDCYRLAQKKRNSYEHRLTFEIDLLQTVLKDCVYRMDKICKSKMTKWLQTAEENKSTFIAIQGNLDNGNYSNIRELSSYKRELMDEFLLPSKEERLHLVERIDNLINTLGANEIVDFVNRYNSHNSNLSEAAGLLIKLKDPYYDYINEMTQPAVTAKIYDKAGATLDRYFTDHVNELKGSESFADYNTKVKTIMERYPHALKNHKSYRKFKSFGIDERCNQLNDNMNKILQQIEISNNRDELYSVKRDYLIYDYSKACLSFQTITKAYQNKGAIFDEKTASTAKNHITPGVGGLSLNTNGLQYRKIINNIYEGKFENINFDREDATFIVLLDVYLQQFYKSCASYLPNNKVEMTRQECAKYEITKNGWGTEISRTCIEWRTVGTGVYSNPEMNNALNQVNLLYARDGLINTWKTLQNPVGETNNLVSIALALKSDVLKLFELNECNGKGLMRLQENLRLFAWNNHSIRIDGAKRKYVEISIHNQNLKKLIDDLVAKQATDWSFNQYYTNSITDLRILNQDAQDRPIEIKANYRFRSGFGSNATGSVRVTFKDGLPECIYFSDFPATCRTANRAIKLEYENGNYSK